MEHAMLLSGFNVREASAGDAEAIDAIHRRAFSGPVEADLVRLLCDGGYVCVSLVAVEESEVVGHVLFSRLHIVGASETRDGLALAPLAVDPALRRRGIGTALVLAGLERAKSLGERIVFVLGDPAYYGRFGFTAEAAAGFECVYACEAFQVLLLGDTLPGGMIGKVLYAPPFDALGGGEHG
jgi:putative acetyltransferase